MCWVIGPKNLVTALSQSGRSLSLDDSVSGSDGFTLIGSYLDGGANHPYANMNHLLESRPIDTRFVGSNSPLSRCWTPSMSPRRG